MPNTKESQDKYLIDGHKLHFHPERIAQLKRDPVNTYPIYVEISPVGHCNHRCLAGNTPVNTIHGPVPIKDLVGKNKVPVYTYSQETQEVFITDAINVRLVAKGEVLVRVWFTDGTYLDCTPDHKLLQIGNYKPGEVPKEAQYFENGDRVRALRLSFNENGYAEYHWGRHGKRKRYRLIMDYLRGYKLSRTEQVHHKDRNKGNDTVANLQYCASAKEHALLHPEIVAKMKANNPAKNMTPEWREKLRLTITGKTRSLAQRINYRNSKLGANNPNYKGLPATGRTRIKEVNHVVYKVEALTGTHDVYCMEVPATGWFFANDVLVKNCTFCAVDYIGYKARSIDTTILINRIKEMARLTVKSIMFAGEGEPLLHKDLPQIIQETGNDIDIAITTNGVMLTDKYHGCLDSIKWIKVSCNAGDKETYGKIHQTKEKDWDTVWSNLQSVCSRRNRASTAIGIQAVVLPDNLESIPKLVSRSKDTGLDYVVLKPYSQHKKSITKKYESITYDNEVRDIFRSLEDSSTEDFKVVARYSSMSSWDSGTHSYSKCLSTPYLWAYIMADGSVYGCSAYLLDERFRYGNIITDSFYSVWQSSARRASIKYVGEELDISECRLNCRMDKVNKYLAQLEEGNPHQNFI